MFSKHFTNVHNFNPLPPHGGRPHNFFTLHRRRVFQSTPSTRRETMHEGKLAMDIDISIHSLHTEGDTPESRKRLTQAISIHSLHTEGDIILVTHVKVYFIFQSTPSTRRETRYVLTWFQEQLFQSTPSTRRETFSITKHISIHYFNPLPPHGGRLAHSGQRT